VGHPDLGAQFVQAGRRNQRKRPGIPVDSSIGEADVAAPGEFLADRGEDGAGAGPWLPTTLEFAPLAVSLPCAPDKATGPGAEPPTTVTFAPPSVACWWL
jgi:hypothetical protein